jgi:hypothetical protein
MTKKTERVKKSPDASKSLRLEWIDPADLNENPSNWRRHPEPQAKALAAAISEVGWAGALLYNERTKHLIDGHCRRELFAGKGMVPVLVGSWDEATEKKILATLDPVSAMAEADAGKLRALLDEVETGNEALQQMLSNLAAQHGIIPPEESEGGPGEEPTELGSRFAVIIECESEERQLELLEQFEKDGLNCRALVV